MTDVNSYFAYLSHPETAQLDGDSKTPEPLPKLDDLAHTAVGPEGESRVSSPLL